MACGLHYTGYRVQGTGYRVQGTGYRVQGAGYRAQGTGHRIQGTGYRVKVAYSQHFLKYALMKLLNIVILKQFFLDFMKK